MALLSAAQVLALWEPVSGAPAHQRLEPLVAALNPGEAVDQDTLGARNRRLLALHAGLGESPLEARVHCGQCATDNEFAIPAAAILACRVPDETARVSVRSGSRRMTFRLPRMADLREAASSGTRDTLGRIVARCRIGGAPDDPVSPAIVASLAARFEALDPAARILVDLACAECKAPLRASVDLAGFVAAAVDRLIDRLQREIHVIAGAYGWTESEILALPQARRRRYVAMITAQPVAAQPMPAPQVRRA